MNAWVRRTLIACACWLALGAVPPDRGVLRAAERGEKPARRVVRYAQFELEGPLSEARPALYLMQPQGQTLHELLDRIEQARTARDIDGLLFRFAGLGGGWAKRQEIRSAIQRCRAAGKDVVCLLEGAGNRTYYAAAAADRIYMVPTGSLMLTGLRLEVMFAKGLLDKIGVEADFVQKGKYKGGAEPFTRTAPSDPFRESLDGVLQDYFDQLVTAIVEGRDIPISRANVLIRRGPFTAEQAREEGLIDGIVYEDELLKQLARRNRAAVEVKREYAARGRAERDRPDAGALLRLLMGAGAPTEAPQPSRPTIAVLHATGAIVRGDSESMVLGQQVTSAGRLIKNLRKAVQNVNVKGIVLRVDSPGGGLLASDQIWRHLRLADERKPVVASFSDTAASGGYYIGAGARRIYAEPGTLTGSIGIFGGKLVLKGLYEKLGLSVSVIEKGGDTGLFSSSERLTPQHREKLGKLLEAGYRRFLERVAETRPEMTIDQVDQVARGRLWTGSQAHRRGLVDDLGGLRDAVQGAKEAAGLPPDAEVHILHLPRSRNLVEMLFFGGDSARSMRAAYLAGLPAPARSYLAALLALRGRGSLCLMPGMVEVR